MRKEEAILNSAVLKLSYNKIRLDYLVALLVGISILLEYFPIAMGVNNYYFVFVLSVCVIYALIDKEVVIINQVNYVPVMYLLALSAYSLLSYNWSIDKQVSLVHSELILKKALLFIIISVCCRNNSIKKNAHWFWYFLVLSYLCIALWEIITWKHLPQSIFYNSASFIPTGPFYGPNHLAAVNNLLLPFILFGPELKHNNCLRFISFLCALIILSITIVEGARIAIITMLAMLLFSFFFLYTRPMRRIGLLVIALLVIGLGIFAKPLIAFTTGKLQKELGSIGQESQSFTMGSIKIRTNLIPENLGILAQSKFMGVGAGNVEHYMLAGRIYRTAGISNSHNFFLELMSNYGLLFLLGFLYIYGIWLYRLWRAIKMNPDKKKYYEMYFFVALMFIPTACLPSTIIWDHHYWILFAFINEISHPANWMPKQNEQI